MRLLLKLAVKNKRHLSLLIVTFFTLFALTIASQMEMFALGVLSDNGADFFTLFASKEKREQVTFKQIEAKWDEIDPERTGVITKQQATQYLTRHKQDVNPLKWVMRKAKTRFSLENHFVALILLLLGVAVFKAIWLFFSRYATQLMGIRISRDLRQQYFEHIQSLGMTFYEKHNIGSLSSRVVGDAGQIAGSINSWMTNYLQTPFTVISCLTTCLYLSWQLSAVLFIGIPMIVIPIVVLARRVRRVARQLQANQEGFVSVLVDFLAGIQTVKIFCMEAFSLNKYKQQNDRMAHLESKTAKYGLLTRPIIHAVTTLCLATVVLFGLYVLEMGLSQLIVYCGLLHLVYEPVRKFAEENAAVQRGIVAAERMFEVLNMKPDIQDHPQAVELKGFDDHITFDHVWFAYGGEWILRDVSFTVRKGETIAIVGPTGAGKTTIVRLLPRLFDVQKGEIRIDGKPLHAYAQKSLRSQIGFVAQKPFLFCDTIEANITLGGDFTKKEIASAADRAHASEFILRMAKTYETMLAEGGQNLSGGQQQRLAIARALIRRTPILILDEATSALDALSELHIQRAIQELHGQVTQVLIAHRLSTIEHADRIIYLERGEKVAEGSRDELLQSCPPFRALWDAHFRRSALPVAP